MRFGTEITPKVGLEADFKTFWDAKNCENTFLSKTNLFKTNSSKPLRQPYPNLAYGVYLKHRNSIKQKTMCLCRVLEEMCVLVLI